MLGVVEAHVDCRIKRISWTWHQLQQSAARYGTGGFEMLLLLLYLQQLIRTVVIVLCRRAVCVCNICRSLQANCRGEMRCVTGMGYRAAGQSPYISSS